jgi:hypothetical protein
MKYFMVLKEEAMVHIASTKYNPDQFVQIDLTHKEIFDKINTLPEIVLFEDDVLAKEYAEDKHLASLTRNSFGMFPMPSYDYETSNDKKLLAIYGNHSVIMQKKSISIVYQIEVTDTSILHKKTDLKNEAYTVNQEDRNKLIIEMAITPCVAFLSEEMAKKEKKSTTVNLIDHKKLTAKPSCTIL